MTVQERWVIAGLVLLFLIGSGAKWCRRSGEAETLSTGTARADTNAVEIAGAIKPTVSRGPVDLNDCSVEELRSLPGIGPVKAERIRVWRNENGRFRTVKDLTWVKGIGEKTIARLAPYVTVRPDSETTGSDRNDTHD